VLHLQKALVPQEKKKDTEYTKTVFSVRTDSKCEDSASQTATET